MTHGKSPVNLCWYRNTLDGGNSKILGIFTPKIWEDEPILTKKNSDGLSHHEPVINGTAKIRNENHLNYTLEKKG